MKSTLQNTMVTRKNTFAEYAESIKLTHTIFSLPFALTSTFLATKGHFPQGTKMAGIFLCLISARNWAMGINRIADAAFDLKNPRTANRAIPLNTISVSKMYFYTFLFAAIFVCSAFWISSLTGILSIPVLIILASYSYTKRFTWLCHFWLGACLGLAPLAAWISITNQFPSNMIALFFSILFWVAGFDILYSLQDEKFDRSENLSSIPARFGYGKSVQISRICHGLSALSFCAFGIIFELNFPYFFGIFISSIMLIWQHFLIHKYGLKKIDMAFFTLNGWISILIFVFTCVDIYLYPRF